MDRNRYDPPWDHDSRWDMHSERQIAASKGGAAAITILNSGSWLALLTQASALANAGIGLPILLWGLGAGLGTLLWLFIYRGTNLQWEHDADRENPAKLAKLTRNIYIGVGVAIASLLCFIVGVVSLAYAIW